MKKITLTLLMVFAMHIAYSQYFHHMYADQGTIGNGMRIRYSGDGHLMAGVMNARIPYGMMGPGPMLVRTDIDGNFSSSFNFNKTYVITDPLGNHINVTGNEVVEFSDGTGYGVMGSYSVTDVITSVTKWGILYMYIDQTGQVNNLQAYEIPIGNIYSVVLTATSESPTTPGNIYATGRVQASNEFSLIFALRVSQNGTLQWGNTYALNCGNGFQTPQDLIENPYNSNDLIVVGSHYHYGISPPNENGFIFLINAVSGTAITNNDYDAGQMENFTAIMKSGDPLNPGFAICGYYEEDVCNYPNNSKYTFAIKFDTLLNIQWANRYEDIATSFYDRHGAHDITGRINSGGNYEYFVVGEKGFPGVEDVIAFKLDANGIPFTQGLFTYNAGNAEFAVSADENTSGIADGLSMYCYAANTSNTNLYCIKSYFNGESDCFQTFEDAVNSPLNFSTWPPYSWSDFPFTPFTLVLAGIFNNNDLQLCHSTTISAGDNSFVAKNPFSDNSANMNADANSTRINTYPNPLHHDDATLQIEVKNPAAESSTVSIFDLMGREVFRDSFKLVKGRNQLAADIGRLNLQKGIYQVVLQKPSGTEMHKLIIEE